MENIIKRYPGDTKTILYPNVGFGTSYPSLTKTIPP
jgi:hypothetical protein